MPYLADMARLERARVLAHHAADAETVPSETVGVALASGDRMGELRLVCHPSLMTVASRHPMVSLWAAHRGSADIRAIDVDLSEAAIVLRQGLDVLVLLAPIGAVAFVQAIQQGKGLGEAAAIAASATPAFGLSSSLALLLGHGALTSIHLTRRDDS